MLPQRPDQVVGQCLDTLDATQIGVRQYPDLRVQAGEGRRDAGKIAFLLRKHA